MNMKEVDSTQTLIDSRRIIARLFRLEAEQIELMGDWDGTVPSKAPGEFFTWQYEFGKELQTLRDLAAVGEGYPDWRKGTILVREEYFGEFVRGLIDEFYAMPVIVQVGGWPYRHLKMDYEAAIGEMRQAYQEIEFDGVVFLIHA